mgnify:CR=1 FL=1
MKNNIRIERAIANITQAELAEKIGVSRQTINAIESNKYVPSTVLALKIARLFEKKTDEKCVRCWHQREDVGQSSEHPELCGRCIENVAGAGEERRIA